MAYLMAHYTQIVVSILAILEIVSIFVPGSSGTLAGIISALSALPGVKDPKVGQ